MNFEVWSWMACCGWLAGRLKTPFNTKIGYIGVSVLGGDLVLSG